jgi:hypothetical protein
VKLISVPFVPGLAPVASAAALRRVAVGETADPRVSFTPPWRNWKR